MWQAFFVKHMREVKVGRVSIDYEDNVDSPRTKACSRQAFRPCGYTIARTGRAQGWADFGVPTLEELERLVFGLVSRGERPRTDSTGRQTILEDETFE